MDPGTLVERLEGLDASTAGPGELAVASGWIQELRGYLHAHEARITRRAGELHATGSGVPAEDLVARRGRASRREAEKIARRGEALANTPAVEGLLAKGRIGAEHADAIASTAGRLDDEQRAEFFGHDAELADAAAAMSPEQFRRFTRRTADEITDDDGLERSERQRAASQISLGLDDDTGMGWIRGDLHPEQYQRIRRALDAEVAALKKRPEFAEHDRGQLRAEALGRLVTGARSTGRRNGAELALIVDHETMSRGLQQQGICEYSDGTPLPVETARRLACEADIIPVVLGGDGMVLDVGRASRLATPEQRVALRAMYRGCAIDGCDRHFDDCEIHHLIEWIEQRGPTDLENLIPACSHHHHRAHEGGWRLELDPVDRTLTVWLPDGTLHSRSRPHLVAERTAGVAA